MISGALGTAQLGLAQLAAYEFLPASGAAPERVVSIIDYAGLNILILPNYYEMMGRWQVFNDDSQSTCPKECNE